MPLQNRVTPTGEIIADPARGTMMGNRGGALHRADRTLGPRRWMTRQWICCRLAFKGRRRKVMSPGRYTELFFLDEATALAAGHRPCFECRREDATRFAMLWSAARGLASRASASDIDRELHAERIESMVRAVDAASVRDLPPGTMIRDPRTEEISVVLSEDMRGWRPGGYGPARAFPCSGITELLTPPSIVAAMRCGYLPEIHETALQKQ